MAHMTEEEADALATYQTPAQIIDELVDERIAASV